MVVDGGCVVGGSVTLEGDASVGHAEVWEGPASEDGIESECGGRCCSRSQARLSVAVAIVVIGFGVEGGFGEHDAGSGVALRVGGVGGDEFEDPGCSACCDQVGDQVGVFDTCGETEREASAGCGDVFGPPESVGFGAELEPSRELVKLCV